MPARGDPPGNPAQLVANVLACGLALLAVFGAIKLLLGGAAPFTLAAG
ncbi:hypothetical protein ACFQY4_21740 [Catellatospora bangladeshensis]